MVMFHSGHTLDRHFAFLGHESEIFGAFEVGYDTQLDDQLLSAIRYDPGVKFVEDNCSGKRDRIAS